MQAVFVFHFLTKPVKIFISNYKWLKNMNKIASIVSVFITDIHRGKRNML